ncbi:MAG: hypothetical protein P8J29_04195, partial [Rhodospirillales bacterium]|nr:hypothetical protein [Rhodospirillales bacterium]
PPKIPLHFFHNLCLPEFIDFLLRLRLPAMIFLDPRSTTPWSTYLSREMSKPTRDLVLLPQRHTLLDCWSVLMAL